MSPQRRISKACLFFLIIAATCCTACFPASESIVHFTNQQVPVDDSATLYALSGSTTVQALRVRDGTVRWSTSLPDFGPLHAQRIFADDNTLLVGSAASITALNPLTGTQIWSISFDHSQMLALRVVDSTIFTLIQTPDDVRHLNAYQQHDGSIIWSQPFTTIIDPMMFAVGFGSIFIGNSRTIHKLDEHTGHLIWSVTYPMYIAVENPQAFIATPSLLIIDNESNSTTENNNGFTVRASDGSLAWHFTSDITAPMAVDAAGDTLYEYGVTYKDNKATNWSLSALRVSDGTVLWQKPTAYQATMLQTPPLVLSDRIVWVAGNQLIATRSDDGTIVWKHTGIYKANTQNIESYQGTCGNDLAIYAIFQSLKPGSLFTSPYLDHSFLEVVSPGNGMAYAHYFDGLGLLSTDVAPWP